MGGTMSARRARADRERKKPAAPIPMTSEEAGKIADQILSQAQNAGLNPNIHNTENITPPAEEIPPAPNVTAGYDYKSDPILSKQKKAAITKKMMVDPDYVYTAEMAAKGE